MVIQRLLYRLPCFWPSSNFWKSVHNWNLHRFQNLQSVKILQVDWFIWYSWCRISLDNKYNFLYIDYCTWLLEKHLENFYPKEFPFIWKFEKCLGYKEIIPILDSLQLSCSLKYLRDLWVDSWMVNFVIMSLGLLLSLKV